MPPIPVAGLAEVLRRWIGRGQIYEGLAAARDVLDDHEWTARQLSARADRILLQRVIGLTRELPARTATWLDAIPAARSQHAFTADTPVAGTDWVATRVRHGWVPESFVARRSTRTTDTLAATALRWTLGRLASVRRGAVQSYPEADVTVRPQLDVAERLLARAPLDRTDEIRPSRQDLKALGRSGRPWGLIARIAEELMVRDEAPEQLIDALLMPDEEIRWRLFHLAVLGTAIQALRERGCSIVSLRPLSASGTGPAFRIMERSGKPWALWFEAAGVWARAGERTPYAEATSGLALKDRALGADLLLMSEEGEALVLECKYSSNPEFVARAGYYQAVGYAAELKSRLCEKVMAIAVGPEGVVQWPSLTDLQIGRIGTCAPSHLAGLIDDFLVAAACPSRGSFCYRCTTS